MSFLDKWFQPKADVGRRQFLRGLITAPPGAVAAVAAIDLKFVPELKDAAREELYKLDAMVEGDLGLSGGKIIVGAPRHIFDPNVRVWRSVANEAGAWADYVAAKTGVSHDSALRITTKLARLLDDDLRTAGITKDQPIDITLPVVTRQWKDWNGKPQCEVGMGVHKETLFDGTEQIQVAFKDKAPRIVDERGRGIRDLSHIPRPKVTNEYAIQKIEYASLGPQQPIPVFDFDGREV
jgi:hypothetical protein